MATTLLRGAAFIATFDDAQTTLEDGSIFIRDNVIERVGPTSELPETADDVIDVANFILLPGLINTHHHFYQTLTRSMPAAQDADLFGWLNALYPIWGGLTPSALRSATSIAIAELLLSGCTTSSDHTYIWPNGARLDDQIEIAQEMGLRFHAGRGSMSVGRSQGGLPPDDLVESEAAILEDSRRVIERYHDGSRYAMTRVVLAPCSPFSVSPDLMRESLALARSYGVHSHTHLAETLDEERYCFERFGVRPVEYAARLGWLGSDVWHAHLVHVNDADIARLGSSNTGAAYCPSSNMRLHSGIAPLGALRRSGARAGFGVDGSASNDSSSMLDEVRMGMLLQRVGSDRAATSAREMLWMATRGGAAVLGRDDVGMLAPGMAADIIGYRSDQLRLAGGAVHDPLAALLFCRPNDVDLSLINGTVRVRDGRLVGVDLPVLVERHNTIARALVRGDR